MQSPLVVVAQPQQTCMQRFCAECLDVTKVMSLVFFTYGLMVLFFEISIRIEECQGTYAQSYQAGGGIILALFVVMWIFWGGLWCWGAQRRQQLSKDIVERQLAMIRDQEKLQEQKDLQEERRMVEQKRRKEGR